MIEATYTITESEFLEGQKTWCPQAAKKIPGYWPMQATGALFGACLGTSLGHLPHWLALTEAGSLILYFGTMQWRKRKARSYQYSVKHDPTETVTTKLDDIGYHYSKQSACGGWLAWNHFTGWRETDHLFILGHGLMYIAIPKRPFSPDDQVTIRAMLRARIEPSA